MSNLTGLADVFFLEEVREAIEKNSFGSVTDDDNNYYETLWEIASSNFSKIISQVAFETSLKYLRMVA